MAQKRSTTTLTLAPLDNRALSNLCGPLDANLRQIEAACDVTITHRGGAFTIAGEPEPAARARAAIERFYTAADRTDQRAGAAYRACCRRPGRWPAAAYAKDRTAWAYAASGGLPQGDPRA